MHLTWQKGCLNHGDWVTKKNLNTKKCFIKQQLKTSCFRNAYLLPGLRCEMRSISNVATLSVDHDCWKPTDKSPKQPSGSAKESIPEFPIVLSPAARLHYLPYAGWVVFEHPCNTRNGLLVFGSQGKSGLR